MCNWIQGFSESKWGKFWLVFIQRSAALMIDQFIDCVHVCVSTMKGINKQVGPGKRYILFILSYVDGINVLFII